MSRTLAVASGNPPGPFVVLIPARNEEATIGNVVRAIVACHRVEVVVIDDNSNDATREVARAAGATVLPLADHLGAWGAIQTGMRHALRQGYRIAITMDADGQHFPNEISRIIAPLLDDTADVVIGSCTQRGSKGKKLAWRFLRLLSGIDYNDFTSGFRAYNHHALTMLAAPRATLLDYQDVGVLILLKRAGLHTVEVPVCMGARIVGKSRIFNSWWLVVVYLTETSILCISTREWFYSRGNSRKVVGS